MCFPGWHPFQFNASFECWPNAAGRLPDPAKLNHIFYAFRACAVRAFIEPAARQPANGFNVMSGARQGVINMPLRPAVQRHVLHSEWEIDLGVDNWLINYVVRELAKAVW